MYFMDRYTYNIKLIIIAMLGIFFNCILQAVADEAVKVWTAVLWGQLALRPSDYPQLFLLVLSEESWQNKEMFLFLSTTRQTFLLLNI